MPHSLDEQAFLRVARNNSRTSFAPLQQALARVEHKAALDFFRLMAVALIAVLLKDRLDLLFVEFNLFVREGARCIVRFNRLKQDSSPKQYQPDSRPRQQGL